MTQSEPNSASATNGNGAGTGDVAVASPYDRIGGAASVKAAVQLFYDRVLVDPELAGYFEKINMEEQRRHMVLMLTTVLGGPDNYNGRSLPEAHQPLNIPVSHYEKVGQHLLGTLTQLGVPADIIGDVRGVLASVEDQVVSNGNRAGA